MRKAKTLIAGAALTLGLGMNAQAAPVDIAFIVDQSGSMSGEFNWIPNVIQEIDAALQLEASVDSTRFGIVGYMDNPMMEGNGDSLAYQDLTSNVGDVVAVATAAAGDLECCRESGYEAAYWSQTNFSWDADSVKIMILLTDENGDQRSDLGPDAPAWAGDGTNDPDREAREVWLGQELDGNGFLLNVVTTQGLFPQWDQAAFDINDAYTGLFDISALRNAATREQFTKDFVSAKVQEIIDEIPPGDDDDDDGDDDDDDDAAPVPEPGTLALLGLGLAGLGFARRKA